MHKTPITPDGFLKIKIELENLKNIARPKIIKEIEIARSHGDLKENAEYHSAREEQYFIEKKIKELEYKLQISDIVDIKTFDNKGQILFGSTVELLNINNNEKYLYKIVGEHEANIKESKISIKSPLARKLISKYKNDIIKLELVEDTILYKIIDVKYI
jgi:transcription elongation factor GreA